MINWHIWYVTLVESVRVDLKEQKQNGINLKIYAHKKKKGIITAVILLSSCFKFKQTSTKKPDLIVSVFRLLAMSRLIFKPSIF